MQPDSNLQVGAYRILTQIGRGGMGEVWLAEHTLLGRRAAIKLLRPDLSASAEMVTRFFNEARAAATISDPGIVQVFDFGHHTDGSAYIVMELLDGEPLDRRLHRVGRLPVGEALRTMRQVAASVGAAHARNIIHRDLKPENIFLVRDAEVPGGERAKVLDFGIAKLSDDPFALKTQTAALIGTPMYMSPEQCRGAGQVDQRTDVYSLGCVLFALLAGTPPFDANGVGDMIAKHLLEAPPRVSAHVRGIAPEVDELILRCLAKAPEHRYANGTELAHAIEALLSITSRTPVPVTIASTIPPSLLPTMLPTPANLLPSPPVVAVSAPIARRGPSGTVAPPVISNTTLSRSAMARAATDAPAPNRRIQVIALGGGALAIGAVVGYIALRSDAPAPAAAITSTPTVTATAPTAPAPNKAPAADRAPTQIATAKTLLGAALGGFRRWAASNAGSDCPTAGELASFVDDLLVDPWGQPLVVTCTDQPANQMVGLISTGPDRSLGSRDDITSWTLDGEVTDLVRGERWKVTRTTRTKPPKRVKPEIAVPAPPVTEKPDKPEPPKPPVKRDRFQGTSLGSDGIPTSR